jgi:hypothetical protein
MGRLPAKFAGKDICFRVPHSMPGEHTIEANAPGQQFPEATFAHNIDKPFEIHRMIVRLTAFDGSDPPVILVVQPTVLEKVIRLRVTDTSKNELMTKNAHLVDTLISSVEGDKGFWDWEDPYTLVRGEQFQIGVDSLVFPVSTPETENIRVEIAFQGFLIVIAPPTEQR